MTYTLQVRIDDDMRDEAQEVAALIGMDLTTAVRVFLRQMIVDKGMPFRPSAEPLYRRGEEPTALENTQVKRTRKPVEHTLPESARKSMEALKAAFEDV